ncbi:hypothetical protein LCGC14_0267930 [marine sediment metagenome]|uniref:Methyltransferase domain-containing protein n=1 Tax=marine sediment metagenome TaxID=412755 RepID=A0A0F9UGX5_9ZZZZ
MFGLLHNPQRILLLNSGYGLSALGIRTILKMHELDGTVVGIDDKPDAQWYFQKIDQMNTTQGTKFFFVNKSIHTLNEEFFGGVSENFDFIFASPEPEEYDRVFNLLRHLYQQYGNPCVIEYKTKPHYYDRLLCGYDFDYRRTYHRFYELIGFEIEEYEHVCERPKNSDKDLRFIIPAYYRDLNPDIWKTDICPPDFSGFIYEQFIKYTTREFKDV